ncbi:NAD(P)H-binding protein [Pediococcus stilesii]|nr:NAD(P)H-binding protein [Pediococcus stilesii]TLQ04458.1 saccharopine dehydrogenase [Pediococcus stilesii]
MKILVAGLDRKVSKEALSDKTQFEVVNKIENGNYDVLYIDMIHIGMDEEFEQLADRIEDGKIKIRKIVFLATAGMDKEISPEWLGDGRQVKELILEVQYVAKLVDETEIPYTILRPVEVQDEVQEVEIIAEGEKIVNAKVSKKGLENLIKQAILTDDYLNQSIGIANKS